mmetsp:Transcript_13291/g.31467  ORF Transcript_13291/g.31467 Transcript_13291/m.31467 type:complete len:237 (+) Transcript_13291:1028-1738(+)
MGISSGFALCCFLQLGSQQSPWSHLAQTATFPGSCSILHAPACALRQTPVLQNTGQSLRCRLARLAARLTRLAASRLCRTLRAASARARDGGAAPRGVRALAHRLGARWQAPSCRLRTRAVTLALASEAIRRARDAAAVLLMALLVCRVRVRPWPFPSTLYRCAPNRTSLRQAVGACRFRRPRPAPWEGPRCCLRPPRAGGLLQSSPLAADALAGGALGRPGLLASALVRPAGACS